MSICGLVDTLKKSRATLRDWGEYRRVTGRWPVLSISMHTANFVAIVGILFGLILYGSSHDWSKARFTWVLLVVVFPYMGLWSWVENKVKIHEIRNRRRFSVAPRG